MGVDLKLILAIAITFFSLMAFSQTTEEVKAYFETSAASTHLLKSVYQNRNFEPVFAKNGQWVITASDISNIESTLRAHGLNPNDYKIRQTLESLKKKSDLKSELFLAENFLKSVVQASTGRVDPRKISDDIKYLPKEFMQWPVFSSIQAAQIPSLFDQVAPKNKIYQSLKRALARLRAIQQSKQWQTVALPESTINKGQSHPVVSAIKRKLELLGYSFTSSSSLFDTEFENVIAGLLQDISATAEKGLSANSKVWRIINSDLTSRIRETELQMEKARWLPDELESRHGIANIANQTFHVQDTDITQNSYVMQFKSIAGQVSRKTPSMRDKVQMVVLNPTWTVTLSIFFNDKLPLIQKDSGYLKKNGFRVINIKTDKEVDPSTINWAGVTRNNIDFQLVQKPSYNNALGVVKFPMTNRFAIYLHDTGDRQLFKNNYRLLSSGCVRLEKPLDFAEYLLANSSWNRAKIDSTVAKPGQVVERETYINLSKPLNIYILNLTVAANENKIQFFDDYYGQNTTLYKKLMVDGYLKN